jgi:hypothetical protein
MKLFPALIFLMLSHAAFGERSHDSGSGALSASARIDIRIIIPPAINKKSDGTYTDNFGPQTEWQYIVEEDGSVTLFSP